MISTQSRRAAGLILLSYPLVVFGGVSLLSLLQDPASGYQTHPLMQDLYRAGHAHAAVLLVLSLILLRWVDDALLNDRAKQIVRWCAPSAAILMPLGFFGAAIPADTATPGPMIYLVYLGAAILVTGFILLGVGLIRK